MGDDSPRFDDVESGGYSTDGGPVERSAQAQSVRTNV